MSVSFYNVDSRMVLLKNILSNGNTKLPEYWKTFNWSWNYHENALEGIVLTPKELEQALTGEDASDPTMVSVYEEVRNLREVIDYALTFYNRPRKNITLDTIKKIHRMLSENIDDQFAGRYRKENPIHRLYFHNIVPPDKISYKMRRLLHFINSKEARKLHPVRFATKVHFRMITIYPFARFSGKVARILMNILLMQHGYAPVVIHSTERQRYYEAIRAPHMGLSSLVEESLANSLEISLRFLDPSYHAEWNHFAHA